LPSWFFCWGLFSGTPAAADNEEVWQQAIHLAYQCLWPRTQFIRTVGQLEPVEQLPLRDEQCVWIVDYLCRFGGFDRVTRLLVERLSLADWPADEPQQVKAAMLWLPRCIEAAGPH
jgi:hypothetical protein